jgi:hypothetical protein
MGTAGDDDNIVAIATHLSVFWSGGSVMSGKWLSHVRSDLRNKSRGDDGCYVQSSVMSKRDSAQCTLGVMLIS